MSNGKLTKKELSRYSRHLVLPEVGIEGQEKIKQAKVLIVGVGGLGSPAALYLAAAGIGTIGIIDFDNVEENNLQRQIIHSTKDAGIKKTESAKNTIISLNPNVKVEMHNIRLNSKNAIEIIKKYDVVIDGSDNFPTKYLVNDACVILNRPNVYGSIFRFDGYVSVFNYKNGPCYRCLFPNPPPADQVPTCAEAGVLGVLPGVIGAIQATEALKIILGLGDILSGRFLAYNALNMNFRELKLSKNKKCPVCGKNPTIKKLIDYEQFCGVTSKKENEVTVKELKKMKDNQEDFVLLDVREKKEWNTCKIDGAKLLPLSEIKAGNINELKKLKKDENIILYCHKGRRSAEALRILRNRGYKNLRNLTGGIDAWAKEIDLKVPIY